MNYDSQFHEDYMRFNKSMDANIEHYRLIREGRENARKMKPRYRILFALDDDERDVLVLHIGPRVVAWKVHCSMWAVYVRV